MNDRREDLSTADLAGQQPRETDADQVREREREGLTREDLEAAPAAERPGPAPDPLQQEQPAAEPAAEREAEPATDAAAAAAGATAAGAGGAGTGTAGAGGGAGSLLAGGDAEAFRARWTDVQNGFVDEPRQAVERADELVAELMQHLAKTFADERGRLEGQWDRGDDVSTDDLRGAFQRYRSFFERLLAT